MFKFLDLIRASTTRSPRALKKKKLELAAMISDDALFMKCCFDVGIKNHGLSVMTAGQLADFKEHFRKHKCVPELPGQTADRPGRQTP